MDCNVRSISRIKTLLTLLSLNGGSNLFAEDSEVAKLNRIIAIQQAQISKLEILVSSIEKRTEGLQTKGDTLEFRNRPLVSSLSGNLQWLGSPSGLKGDKGDQGNPGSNGNDGIKGKDGTNVCGRLIRIRSGVRDDRGDTWLSLGWGIATTDARYSLPNTLNYLECP